MKTPLQTVSLATMIDNHIGKTGTPKREIFENELKIEIKASRLQKANPKMGNISISVDK